VRMWRFLSGRRLSSRQCPVNVYPFIEAEKACGRNVKRACELLKVSRAAFCQHLVGPSRRDQEDAALAGETKRFMRSPTGPLRRRGSIRRL
jgi:hypothetical protein